MIQVVSEVKSVIDKGIRSMRRGRGREFEEQLQTNRVVRF